MKFLILSKRIISIKELRCVSIESFKLDDKSVIYSLFIEYEDNRTIVVTYDKDERYLIESDLKTIIDIILKSYDTEVSHIFDDAKDSTSIMNDMFSILDKKHKF